MDHKKKCAKCIYRGKINGLLICDYIGIMGYSRPCPANDCTVYSKGKKAAVKKGISLT